MTKVNRKLSLIKKIKSSDEDRVSLPYDAFESIPTDMILTEDTPRGTICLVAGRPRSDKFLFREYRTKQSKMFPYGGYILWDCKHDQEYCCYFDCACIHPDVFKKTRKKSVTKRVSAKKSSKKSTKSAVTKRKITKKSTKKSKK